MTGTFAENGALDQLGKKYFSDLYIDQIGSEDYRKVLTAMAEGLDAWISRSDITKKSGLKQKTVDNALRALKEEKSSCKIHEREANINCQPNRLLSGSGFALLRGLQTCNRKPTHYYAAFIIYPDGYRIEAYYGPPET